MPRMTRTIRHGKDDTNTKATRWWSYAKFNRFGQWYCPWWECFPTGEDQPCACSIRFTDITLPPSAIINQAYMSFEAHPIPPHPYWGWPPEPTDRECNGIIHAEKAQDPEQIHSYADFFDRPRTDQATPWHNIPFWQPGQSVHTPDLSAILQELIATYELYQTHIQFFISDDDSERNAARHIYAREYPPHQRPKLHIEYTVPGPTPATNWLIIAISHVWTSTGKIITITTEVACHLRLRYDDKPPVRHERSRVRRGLTDWRDPSFGFQEWTEIDQVEIGDTFVHTFVLDPWPVENDLWYYFVASIAGGDTKSRSPFFHQEKALYPWVLILLEPWDRYGPPAPPMTRILKETWSS